MHWRRVAIILAWSTTALALVVLIVGWGLDVAIARTLLPNLVHMAPWTAAAIAGGGGSLLLLLAPPRWRPAGRALGGAVLLLALLILAEYPLRRSLGFDNLLFPTVLARSGRELPGRPAPNTAFTLALVGAALLLLNGRTRTARRVASGCAVAAALISLHAVIGYALQVESLYRISAFNPIALHTAIALLLLSVGMMAAQPQHGLVRLLSGEGASGYMTRRLLPVAVGAPFVIGFLKLQAERRHVLGSELGTTLMVVLGIMVTGAAVWLSALALEREERRRQAIATERERLLRELEVERSRLREVFEQVPVAVSLVTGRDFVFELANPEYLRISGRTTLLGQRFLDAFPETPPDAPVMQMLKEVFETGRAFIADAFPVHIDRHRTGSPEVCYFLFTTQPVHDAEQRITGLLTVAVDVTSRVHAEHERERLLQAEREARATAEIANQAKSQFLSHMSHELRTPLNAILGYAELLQSGIAAPLSERAASFVDRIRLAAEHQKQLIEDVLTFSRLQAGREEVQPARFALADLLSEIRAVITPLAEQSRLELAIDATNAPPSLHTDPRKLRQVLLNLLGNAVKFTPSGRVSLTVACSNGSVSFTVSDTGIGIDPAHHERLFEPFWQVDSSLTRTTEGSGLGLTIARRLARLLGGDIRLESAPGQGSSFLLNLPEHPSPLPPGSTPAV